MIVCRREMLAVERSPPLDRSETLRRSPGTGESVGRLSKVSSFFIESFTLKFLLPLEISFFLPSPPPPSPWSEEVGVKPCRTSNCYLPGNFVEFLWDVASESSFERREEKQGMSPGQIY